VWFIKDDVKRLSAYDLETYDCRIKINQNENPYEVPAEIKDEVLSRLSKTSWCRYPPFVPKDLHRALAQHYGVDSDWVLAGNGSNEVLYATLAVCLQLGDSVVIPVPTFTLYSLLSRVFSAQVHSVPLLPDMGIDPGAIIETADRVKAKVICLCSPNNPTGRQYSRADVTRIVKTVDSLVILDEAYVEFAPESLMDLVHRYQNLAVYRTFSKAMAYAGLRIGAVIARPELVREISKGKLPYAINTFTTLAAIVACERAAALAPAIERLKQDRSVLMEGLSKIPGVQTYPSQSNFILVRLERPVAEVFTTLKADGILVRDVSHYPGLAGHLRISVGTTHEVQETLERLGKAMQA
jgi:histidinol-phosphate aminotransferase